MVFRRGEELFFRTDLLEVKVGVSLKKSIECFLSYNSIVASLSPGQAPAINCMNMNKGGDLRQ